MRDQQSEEENDTKVYDQRRRNPHDRDDLVDHLVSLRGEEYEDGKEESDQRPRSDPFEKSLVVPSRTENRAKANPRRDCCPQGNSEEDGNACRHHVV